MIKLEELRVGNWVYFKDPAHNITKPVQINYIDQYQHLVGYKSESGDIFCEQKYVEPIPLTEEILLKCGFRKKETKYTYEYAIQKYLILSCYKNDINDSDFCAYWNDCQMWDVMSVYQLQNLYFAITGEELEVKL